MIGQRISTLKNNSSRLGKPLQRVAPFSCACDEMVDCRNLAVRRLNQPPYSAYRIEPQKRIKYPVCQALYRCHFAAIRFVVRCTGSVFKFDATLVHGSLDSQYQSRTFQGLAKHGYSSFRCPHFSCSLWCGQFPSFFSSFFSSLSGSLGGYIENTDAPGTMMKAHCFLGNPETFQLRWCLL